MGWDKGVGGKKEREERAPEQNEIDWLRIVYQKLVCRNVRSGTMKIGVQ